MLLPLEDIPRHNTYHNPGIYSSAGDEGRQEAASDRNRYSGAGAGGLKDIQDADSHGNPGIYAGGDDEGRQEAARSRRRHYGAGDEEPQEGFEVLPTGLEKSN